MTELSAEELLKAQRRAEIRKDMGPAGFHTDPFNPGMPAAGDPAPAADPPAVDPAEEADPVVTADPEPTPDNAAAPSDPPPGKTPAEIDAELGLPPVATGLPNMPDKATTWDILGAAWRSETIRTDAWNDTEKRRRAVIQDMYALLPPEVQNLIGAEFMRQGAYGPTLWPTVEAKVLEAAAAAATTDPESWADWPLSAEALRERIDGERKADLDEAEAVLAQPGGGFSEFIGTAARAITDETSVVLLPFGLSGSVWRKIAGEAALGAVGEAAVLPKEYRVAEELELEDPNAMARIAMGAAAGGAFAGAIIGIGRGASAIKAKLEARSASIRETLPEGVDRVDHEAQIEAAEAELRGDLTVEETFDWSKHRSKGGLREDAISGLDPEFRGSLEGLIASAPPGIREGLSVMSGYRSIERQRELWEASDKTGKWVARPGHSQHNHGRAVDLEWNGKRLDQAPPEVREWVHANAGKFGLTFPMGHEPWHIEPIGARGGKGTLGEIVGTSPALPPVGPDAPPDWARIRNGIFAGESGADWNALFGYSNRRGGKFSHIKPSEMTVDQWLEFQDPNGPYGQWVKSVRPDPEKGVATPMGAYQIVGDTLRMLKRDLGLKGDEVMTPEFQDYLAQQIYLRQGTGAWVGYKGPRDSYTPGSVDGPAPDMGSTSRGYTGSGQVSAGDGFRIDVDYEVVDYRTLIRASGDLQPRDRSRINSDDWVAATAARLDPADLMPDHKASHGTPIVGPDNVIESGNGRSMAIARAYERHPDRAQAYRGAIEAAGYAIPEGVDQPVLIARRKTDLTPEQRRQFVIEAQDGGTARMTPTELARATAQNLQASILSRLDPSAPLASDANGAFVRAALATLPRSERNAMFDASGALNAQGQRQLKEALFARAWPDPDILARYTEGAPAELKSLMEALEQAAPAWAALKADIEAGLVRGEMDISGFVLDAMRLIGAARELAGKQGMPTARALAELLDQVDLIEGAISPLTAALVRKMWKGGRAAPADEVASFLTRYADEARKAGQAGGMFDAPGPREVLRTIDPDTFKDLPEDLGQARGFARPGGEAPPEAVAQPPGRDFDQGAQSPEAEAVHAEIEAGLRGNDAGPFGPVYEGFNGDPEGAIAHLMARKTGEVRDAFAIPGGQIGNASLVYGNDQFGLRHIQLKRPEMLTRLPDLLRNGRVETDPGGQPRLYIVDDADPANVAVIRLDWDGVDRRWLVTAYQDDWGKFARDRKEADRTDLTDARDPASSGQDQRSALAAGAQDAPPAAPARAGEGTTDLSAPTPAETARGAVAPALARSDDMAPIDMDALARDQAGRDIARARDELAEFAEIEIALPDGTMARARDILDDLDADRAADAFLQACGITQKGPQ